MPATQLGDSRADAHEGPFYPFEAYPHGEPELGELDHLLSPTSEAAGETGGDALETSQLGEHLEIGDVPEEVATEREGAETSVIEGAQDAHAEFHTETTDYIAASDEPHAFEALDQEAHDDALEPPSKRVRFDSCMPPYCVFA